MNSPTSPKASDIFSALGPEAGTSYRLGRAIAEAFPEHALVETASDFDLEGFANAGACEANVRSSPHSEVHWYWRRAHGLSFQLQIGFWDVVCNGQSLIVARAKWPERFATTARHYVLARERTAAEGFMRSVAEWSNEPHGAVLTFRGGCWERDHDTWKEIQAASFADLVLAANLAQEIRDDFSAFLGAKAEYERYSVPWKRGVLFVGPPGNGKTHCLRAVVRMLGISCLYVQSLKSRYEPDDANIASVFARAREITPCCLVFEDLDSMLTPENRSMFLNQLDGFANSSGLLTLATTNHPDRLDPAIVERPSRFDRKYHFGLPAPKERSRYIEGWRQRLDPAMAITDAEMERLVDQTEDFSFAYLKELFMSATMRWVAKREAGTMFLHLESQLRTLREQMKTAQGS